MDSETRATVPSPADGLPSNGTPSGAESGDASTGNPYASLEALLDAKLAEATRNIQENVWRGTQKVMDQRFARIEPMAQAIPQLQQQVGSIYNTFQQAQEADLDPDTRKARQTEREYHQALQQAQANAYNANLHAARSEVFGLLADNGIPRDDPEIDWHEDQFRANPWQWTGTMASQIANLSARRAVARNRAEQDAVVTAERRRANQLSERERAMEQNLQRAEAGRLETGTPANAPKNWYETYQNIKATQGAAAARKYVEGLNKQVVRDGVRTTDQFRF